MRTHRFGRKIKLPATIAIKHQIRMRMAEYEIKKVEAEARAEASRAQPREELLVSADGRQEAPLKKSGI
jgi:hypothetical protein